MDARPEPSISDQRASSLFSWRPLRHQELDHELIWLSTSAGTVLMGFTWLGLGRPLPPCVFHALTGIPCPTCGCTRATLKLLQGDIPSAVALNPLYILGVVAVVLFNLYAAVVLAGRLPRLRLGNLPRGVGSVFRWGAIAAVLCNWAWLIYSGV